MLCDGCIVSAITPLFCQNHVFNNKAMFIATVNRSHHIPKILPRAGGVVDPVNFFPTSSLIAMQNLVAVSHILCVRM